MLLLEQLYTGAIDANDNDNDDNNDTNDDDNNTWKTNHDCIGSLACMPNDPKTSKYICCVQTPKHFSTHKCEWEYYILKQVPVHESNIKQ